MHGIPLTKLADATLLLPPVPPVVLVLFPTFTITFFWSESPLPCFLSWKKVRILTKHANQNDTKISRYIKIAKKAPC